MHIGAISEPHPLAVSFYFFAVAISVLCGGASWELRLCWSDCGQVQRWLGKFINRYTELSVNWLLAIPLSAYRNHGDNNNYTYRWEGRLPMERSLQLPIIVSGQSHLLVPNFILSLIHFYCLQNAILYFQWQYQYQ